MATVVHLRVQCPRCGRYGARELNRLPEEGHGVCMCPFCKHTWCQEGRITTGDGPGNKAVQPPDEAS